MFLKVSLVCLILWSTTLVESSKIRAAPYFMPLDNKPPDVSEAIKNSGLNQFILAFVLAPSSGGCVPTWDGNIKQKVSEDTKVLKIIETIRAAGGDVSVSFGGYTGLELGNPKGCSDAQQLADAYQSVIDKYDLTNVDFDIEGDELGEDESEHKRFKAIKILKERAKAKGKELFVSLTMPGTSVGLSDLARDEARKAVEDGVVIDLYKVMAFDYGGSQAEQVASVIRVMEMAHQQIKQIRTDLSDKDVYASTGLILMNGHTDQWTELYELDDFAKMIKYAKDKNLGRVSFWSLNRDRACVGEKTGWVSGVCSSVEQSPYDFSKLLLNFDHGHTSQTVEPTKATTHQPITEPTKPTTHSSHETTVNHTKDSTDKPTESPKVETSTAHGVNDSTTPYISTSHVTFSPIIDNIDCRKQADNSHFPFKNDCTEYIRCYNRLAHLETCPKGTIYDTKLHICNWPTAVDRPECK